MRAELIEGGVLDLADDAWADLYARDGCATAFSAPEWAAAWVASWKGGGTPWVLRVTDGATTRGIVPLALQRRGPLRVLGMLGKEPGDYWDIVAADDDRSAVAAAAAAELQRRSREWDLCILSCLPPGSPSLESFQEAGLNVAPRIPVRSPHIPLPSTFDAYLEALSKSRRANLRRHLRRLDSGEVTMRAVTSFDDLPAAIELWRSFRERQWSAAGRRINPEHLTPAFAAFMQDAARRMIPRELASLTEFQHAGRVVGMYLNFHDARAFYWYLGGFDPDIASLGIGKIAVAAGIRSSVEAGRSSFDFTRGTEAYKYWYGAVDRELPSCVIGHDQPRSRVAIAIAMRAIARRDRDQTAGAADA